MQELIDCLERCVRQSVFVSDRLGRIGWEKYRGLFHQRGWDDLNCILAVSATLETDDGCVADLAAKLEPVLADYQHPGTGRIRNGLYSLLGEPGGWVHPSVNEFARMLISGAVKIGAERVVGLLLEWVRGEPFPYRINVLLQGAEIDGRFRLPEGIGLWKLPNSSGNLPTSLPFSVLTEKVSVRDFMGGVVLSFDCEMAPALYLPDDKEVSEYLPRNGKFKIASDRIANFHVSYFCESMSLACDGFVDWFLVWRDHGDLEAFAGIRGWDSFRFPKHAPKTNITQVDLEETLKVHEARHRGSTPRENLELAMRRWMGSKRSGTDSDKLIELRIALEALYEIKELNEKGFRIATYGAWHLGEDFERRQEIWETLHNAYRDSSSAVHGGKPKHAAKDPQLISFAQDICRDGILKLLEETKRPKWEDEILGKVD